MASEKQFKIMVDPDLHRRAKIEAARRGMTLSEVVRDALAEFVGVKPKRKPRKEESIDKH